MLHWAPVLLDMLVRRPLVTITTTMVTDQTTL